MEQGKPIEISFVHWAQTSAANMGSCTLSIWCDAISDVAPVHENSNGRDLVTLRANFSHFSMSEFRSLKIKRGADGNNYYEVPATIEATFYSASTKYVLVCRGQRCDTVTAEYV